MTAERLSREDAGASVDPSGTKGAAVVTFVVGVLGIALGFLIGWLLRRDRLERPVLDAMIRDRDAASARLAEVAARLETADQELAELRTELTGAQEQLAERTEMVGQLQYDLAECRDELGFDHTEVITPLADEDEFAGAEEVSPTAAQHSVVGSDTAELSTQRDATVDMAAVDVDRVALDADIDDEDVDTAGPDATEVAAEHDDDPFAPVADEDVDPDLEDITQEVVLRAPVEPEEGPGDAPVVEEDPAEGAPGDVPVVEEDPAERAPGDVPVVEEDPAEGVPGDVPVVEQGAPDDLPGAARPPANSQPDDLKRIRGIGPAMERLLNEEGITTFRQLAVLTDAGVEELRTRIPRFSNRVRREHWIEQAQRLHVETHGDEP